MENNTWANDKLDRQADGDHLINFLSECYNKRKTAGQVASYVLNIDASWGEGKTFFLQCLAAELRNRGHIVAEVNAWKDDLSDDPLIAILAAIEEALEPMTARNKVGREAFSKAKAALGTIVVEASKQLTTHALKSLTGISISTILAGLSTEDDTHSPLSLEDREVDAIANSSIAVWEKAAESLIGQRVALHRSSKQAISKFQDELKIALASIEGAGKALPIYIFVDELDRCRPLYAIRLLEDLKHIFQTDHLVYVVATDSQQLAHSVKAIYGSEFEAKRYLRRFFDRVFVFPDVDKKRLVRHLFETAGIDHDKVFHRIDGGDAVLRFSEWIKGFNISNRDLEQCFDIITTFITSWPHRTKIEPVFLLALVWEFYNGNWDKFESLASFSLKADPVNYGWMIEYVIYDAQQGSQAKKRRQSGAILSPFLKLADQNLYDVVSKRDAHPLNDYYVQEFQDLHGNRYTSGEKSLSVLREYASRVRNAGRVLDTI